MRHNQYALLLNSPAKVEKMIKEKTYECDTINMHFYVTRDILLKRYETRINRMNTCALSENCDTPVMVAVEKVTLASCRSLIKAL